MSALQIAQDGVNVMSKPILSVPVSFFSMAVGLLAFGNTWQVAARLWHLPSQVGHALWSAGLAVWVTLLIMYIRKWILSRADAVEELTHPLHGSLATLLPVASMLAAVVLIPFSRTLALSIVAIALLGQLALGLWLNGRLWMGARPPETITTAIYLPSVAQSFVAASAAAAFGWNQVGLLFFGVGLLAWLVLESLVMQRAALGSALPPPMRPMLGIQLAPAVVGGGSYLSLTAGEPTILAWMLLGYGLYQALLLVRLLPWIREQAFAASYWAFSFGVAALPALAMRMVERGATGYLLELALVLFVAANGVFAILILKTLVLLASGDLTPGARTPIKATANGIG